MKVKKILPWISDGIWESDVLGKVRLFKNAHDYSNVSDSLGTLQVKFWLPLVFLVVTVLLLRLFYLNIVEGKKNRELADSNSIRLIQLDAPRGKILAKNAQVLAYSNPSYFLEKDFVKEEMTSEQAKAMESQGLAGENFTGSLGKISKTSKRIYPYSTISAHITGYTSLVQNQDLVTNQNLTNSDFVGRLGLEQEYDNVLRGVGAKKIVEVDASGNAISLVGQSKETSGSDIQLSLDIDLQKKAYEILNNHLIKQKAKAGALIITNPNSGEILALISLPSFDPSDIGKYVTSEQKPIFNRVISGSYPPGSIFKISTALAGLESGKITRETEIEDVGQFELGGLKFSNWFYTSYGGRDGVLKIDRAIARSNDIFFYRVGEKAGLENLRKEALLLGFGQQTGIDLPGEAYGLLPDEVWKKANLGEDWFLGDTMHMAIGQGFMLSTPIQINRLTDFMANGGKLVKPYLVNSIKSQDGKIENVEPKEGVNIKVDSENFQIVRSGMRQACQKGGTAWPFFDAPYEVGCKTGTAEKFEGNPHAWFSAFAPFENPTISVTVLVEDGGEGSSVAAPIAREILDWWFSKK